MLRPSHVQPDFSPFHADVIATSVRQSNEDLPNTRRRSTIEELQA